MLNRTPAPRPDAGVAKRQEGLSLMRADTQPDPSSLHQQAPGRVPVILAALSAEAEEQGRYVVDALQRQLRLPHGDTPEEPDWDLAQLHQADLDAQTPLAFILLVVEADLRALRQAYSRLKLLAQRRPVRCGVLVLGARDAASGSRHYRRLAMGAMRFLDLPLLNLGLCPQRGKDFGMRLAWLAQCIREAGLAQDVTRRRGSRP